MHVWSSRAVVALEETDFGVEFRHERSDKGWCQSTEVDMWLVLPGEACSALCVVCDGCPAL